MTLVFTHPIFAEHETPDGHPEQADRIRAVWQAVDSVPGLEQREAPICAPDALTLAHSHDYLDRLRDARPAQGLAQLDSDTWMSPASLEAGQRAVGGVVAAVDAVLAGEAMNAFVASRPPGHHAERETAMGFCLYSSTAIGALHAARAGARVAVVDFDVHHGNGTQDVLKDEADILFVSSHQMPLWPGTGAPHETGCGNVLNVPLPPGSDGAAMREAYERLVFPRLAEHAPDLLLVSAGFDAHVRDPLAQLNWRAQDYTWITARLCEACPRLVLVLEGGYDLTGLTQGVSAHLTVLTQQDAASGSL